MEPLSNEIADAAAIDLPRFERACAAAVAAAASAGNAVDVFDKALRALHDELGGPGVAAFVLEHGRLWSVGVRGYAMIPDGLPLDEGVIGRAVRTSTAQLVLDVNEDPDFVEVSRATVSELSAPLMMPTGVVGVLNIETNVPLPAGSDAAVAELLAVLAAPMDELRGSRTDLSSLARLFVYMSSLRDPQTIAEVAVRSLGRVLPVETSQLLLLDEDGQLVESTEWSATAQGPEPLTLDSLRALRARIDASAVFELLDTTAVSVPELAGLKLRSVVLIPLRANGEEIGLLVGASRFAREFDRGQGELASLLAAHTAASLDAAVALDRERRSAHTDPLTGLYNRRGLEELLERQLGGAQEHRSELSLVVLDCDDFKDVNDRAGHEFGDALLREVGLVLQRACPPDARGGAARRRRVRRHASRHRCGCGIRGDRQAPPRARCGPRRGRLPAAAERRDLDLSLRRRSCDAAAPRRRPGAVPREGPRQEPGGRLPRDPARRVADGAASGAQRSQPERLGRGRLGARRRDGRSGCDLGRAVGRRRVGAARQGDRLRRRRNGHQHLQGRRLSAHRHDQARLAGHRPG